MKNKFTTKTTNETTVTDCGSMVRLFNDNVFRTDIPLLINKKILTLSDCPLAEYYCVNNNVTCLVTSLDREKTISFQHSSINVIHAEINIEEKNKIKKIVKKVLQENCDLNSFDYIFSNFPYIKDMYLAISELAIPYLNENGYLFTLGPTNVLLSTKKTFKQKYPFLWKHCESFVQIDPEKYIGEEKILDQYNDVTNLGIITFVNKETNFDVWSQWRNGQEPDVVELIDHIEKLNISSVAEKIVKNISSGICVPVKRCGGGYMRRNTLTYDDVILINGSYALNTKGQKIHKSEIRYGINKKTMKVERGIIEKTIEDANIHYNAYHNDFILQGFAGISTFGTKDLHTRYIPYIPPKNAKTHNDIKDYLHLNENHLKTLLRYSKPSKLEKDRKKKQTYKQIF